MMTRALVAAVVVLALGATAATARGCNGVVNQLVWGCAAWDNNNGPQYPNWHGAPQQSAPAQNTVKQGGRLISQDGGTVMRNGTRLQTGNGIVAQGGGN